MIFRNAHIIVVANFLISGLVAAADRPNLNLDFWQAHNRTLALQVQQRQHAYREIDTKGLTTDGTLNSETGAVQGWAVQARWQGSAGPMPLWLEAGTSEASGQTDYNGYLQNGNKLIPYRAKTGNHWQRTDVRVGYPWSPAALPNLQVVPFAHWGQHHWQRNLVQYSETYRFDTQGAGLLVQWQVPSQWAGSNNAWVLEASYQRGRPSPALVQAPQLGFEANQAAGDSEQTDITLHYRRNTPNSETLTAHALSAGGLQFKASQSQTQHGASPVVNGLQSPPNTNRITTLSAGVVWHY